MKRILTIALLAFAFSMSAQTKTDIPAYRSKGYAGSVSFTDQYIVWLGFDTSHGYMFNEHHYLGGGFGFFLAPVDDLPPTMIHAYAEYKSYWFKRKNTPTAGLKAGYCMPVTYRGEGSGFKFMGAFEMEPNIGWDWGLKSGKGLSLSLGATLLMTEWHTFVMPKLSFGINF